MIYQSGNHLYWDHLCLVPIQGNIIIIIMIIILLIMITIILIILIIIIIIIAVACLVEPA